MAGNDNNKRRRVVEEEEEEEVFDELPLYPDDDQLGDVARVPGNAAALGGSQHSHAPSRGPPSGFLPLLRDVGPLDGRSNSHRASLIANAENLSGASNAAQRVNAQRLENDDRRAIIETYERVSQGGLIRVGHSIWPMDSRRIRRNAPGCKRSRPATAGLYDPVSTRADFERLAAEQAARPAVIIPPQTPAESARAQQSSDGVTCAGCGSGTHKLITCLEAGHDGMMEGCPWCNTLAHSFTQCSLTKNDKSNQILLAGLRGNMPSFQKTESWVAAVRAVAANGPSYLTSFPWTPEFSKKMAASTSQFQAELDAIFNATSFCRRNILPQDPATKDWSTVQETCASALGDRDGK